MASLNGIDIASYQAGINLGAVPLDFVIIKSTQGTSYINPDFTRAIKQAQAAGKLVGVYHYLSGAGAQAEISHFFNVVKPYVGNVVVALDWESGQNSAWGNQGYLEQAVAALISATGVRPLLYASQSVYGQISAVGKKYDCGLWVAQYASNTTTGYQATPWNEGKYSCTMRQYSSAGRLGNWGSNLDLNKFYGDATAWRKYANPSGKTVAPPSVSTPAASGGLTVDGKAGAATIKRLQKILGTVQDGIVSGQAQSLKRYFTNFIAVRYGNGGSLVIKAIQRRLGVGQDGRLGPNTVRALQRHLGVKADGYAGPNTVKTLQARLNGGSF